MNDYIQTDFTITPADTDAADLLAQMLADIGFESFVDSPEGLQAFVPAAAFDATAIDDLIADFAMPVTIRWTKTFVEGRDWNEEWERNYFQPIVVGDRCAIHSSFHTDIPQAEFDITIDPKMAFGTGHHSTTSLMIEHLLDMGPFCPGTTLIDMGTGSGILAILAAMLGARATGIEIDEAAYVNAIDNVALNGVADKVNLIHGDASALASLPQADILLANINRNIILNDIATYAGALRHGGVMCLSGFYDRSADLDPILAAASANGLTLVDKRTRQDWCALRLTKA